MKLMVKSVLFTSLLATAMVANAGARYVYQVNAGSNYAYGAIPDARGSSDATQYIGCWENDYGGSCFAVDTTGTYRSCYTTNPSYLARIRSLDSSSYIYFTWDSAGNCNYIFAMSSSYVRSGAISGY
jgi:hypothetical protein